MRLRRGRSPTRPSWCRGSEPWGVSCLSAGGRGPIWEQPQGLAPSAASVGAGPCGGGLVEPVGVDPTIAVSPPLPDSSTLLTAESHGEDSAGSPSNFGGSTPQETEDGVDEEMLEARGQVVDQGAPAPGRVAGVPRRRQTKTVPVEPARKSTRLTGTASATPVLQRAQERTAVKNLDSGTSNDFAVLPGLPDSHLVTVSHDCGMAFVLEQHTVSETLSLIRAKEEAQAALALAAFRREVELARAARSTAGEDTMVVGATGCPPLDTDSTLVDVPVLAATRANTGGKSKAVLAPRPGRRKARRL
jgi:hypothetical protein